MTRSSRNAVRRATLAVLGVILGVLGIGALATSASAATAQVWATRPSGAILMQNSQVLVGQTLVIHVSGFEPGATVLLQLGPQELVEQIVTDDGGAGTTRVVVPKLRTDSYSITAITATVNATFVVSVVNPATTKPITPAPSSLPTVARSATPTASGTTHATSSQAGTSAAYTPALANTGSPNTFGLTIAGMVLLAFGATAIKIGAPRVFGRHERIAGAHCR